MTTHFSTRDMHRMVRRRKYLDDVTLTRHMLGVFSKAESYKACVPDISTAQRREHAHAAITAGRVTAC